MRRSLPDFLWGFFLKPYQKDRIFGFIDPQADPLGVNYSVTQSKIAIGSADFWGKGFGAGTQTQLSFLPENHADFIFASFTEEWGLLGASVVLLFFFFVIYRIIHIGLRAKNNDARFIAFGAGLVLTLHFLLNIGSNLGFTPVTGVGFPFFSYGGSHVLTTAILISIIVNINLESR